MLVENGHELFGLRSLAESAFQNAVLRSDLAGVYWRIAPRIHRARRYRLSGYVDPPTDPFALYYVDPDRIERFSGREFPPWTDRWERFGAIEGGEWDRRDFPPVRSSYRGPDPSLYLAERFTRTPLYGALHDHFVDGVPWTDLPLIIELIRRARRSSGPVWQDCSTPEEIRAYCRRLDRLHRSMRENGCLPIRELNARRAEPSGFRQVMEHEILVDIGRDGEPLFVSGRHRLSIARILGLERVPVGIVVRHREWDGRSDPAASDRPVSVGRRRPTRPQGIGNPLDVPW